MSEAVEAGSRFRLNNLYFYLTEGCNLRCCHCWIAPKYQAEDRQYGALDGRLFESIISQARPLGLSSLKLTGGEPLIHPDISSLIARVRENDLRLTIETNGVECSAALAGEIAAAKGSFVSVSLDGDNPETHEEIRGVEGCFEKAVQGVRNLVGAGLKPQIIMTVMRHNRDQLEGMVRLAESLGAGSVKFNVLMPTVRGEGLHKRGHALDIAEYIGLGRHVETTLARSSKIRLIYSHPHAFRPLSRMYGGDRSCNGRCGILGLLGVLSDGSYALCGIGENVEELVFGHAGRDRLADVWNHTPVLNELREHLPKKLEGTCGRCLMKGICLGSCIAQNYYLTKSLWAPFWFCEQAEQLGLFPQSRQGGGRC